jgi:hypothetical protein
MLTHVARGDPANVHGSLHGVGVALLALRSSWHWSNNL